MNKEATCYIQRLSAIGDNTNVLVQRLPSSDAYGGDSFRLTCAEATHMGAAPVEATCVGATGGSYVP